MVHHNAKANQVRMEAANTSVNTPCVMFKVTVAYTQTQNVFLHISDNT